MGRRSWCIDLDPEAFSLVCQAYAELRGVNKASAIRVIRKNVLYLLAHGIGEEALTPPSVSTGTGEALM